MNVIVRYKVKADRAEENASLIQAVFAELAQQQPGGLRYTSYRLGDGVSFVHVATVEAKENPLLALDTFKRFTAAIKDRCEEPPVTSDFAVVGRYPSA
jgi:hypothetical protein